MNITHQGIITLLRSAITEEKLPLPEGFDIEDAYTQVKRHHMVTLAYDGAVRCGVDSQHPVMQKMFREYCVAMLKSEGQMREVERIFAAFEDSGIDYMPLKGCKLKALYPKPELRLMGDADILIRTEQYGQVTSIMESLGFVTGGESEKVHIWKSQQLFLELHKQLLSPEEQNRFAGYGDGWDLASRKLGHRHFMSPEDEMIFLFVHFTKHFRGSGIGCRHVVDLWVYRRGNPNMNETYIRRELEKMHLLRFYENMLRLFAVWFEGQESDSVTLCISEYIFHNGNWGTMENMLYSEEVKRTDKINNAQYRSFVETIFPKLSYMQMSYNILYRHPWLCPVYYVVRWVDVLLHRRRNIGRKLGIIRNMSDEKVTAHRQALNYMGLDFYSDEN